MIMSTKEPDPKVIRESLLGLQVCVPEDWNDEEVKHFANRMVPVGTINGSWHICKEGEHDNLLGGCPERNPCDKRKGYVHVLLHC